MLRLILFLFALVQIATTQAQESYVPAHLIKHDQNLTELIKKALDTQRELIKDLPKKQRKLADDYVKNRSSMISGMLENGNFILNTPLNTFLDGIFQRILKANPDIDPTTTLLLSRSGSVNAFTTGDGFFVLNLGLLTQMRTEDELAFIIGHELSHQSLDHVNASLREKAEIESDSDRNKELRRIMRSEYQVNSKIKSVILPGMIASRQFKRQREFAADSLGFLYATRSGFSSGGSLAALGVLDSIDVSLYGKNVPWQLLYESMSCHAETDFENVSTASSLGSFTTVNTELVEKLRTHPDCELRIEKLVNEHSIEDSTMADSGYDAYRTMARMELIESYRLRHNLGAALYHALQLQFDYPENEFALENAAHFLGLISVFKKERQLGQYVDASSVYQPDDYSEFLEIIWEASIAECSCLAYNMNSKVSNISSPERYLSTKAIAAYSKGDKEEAQEYAREYIEGFPLGDQINRMNYILNLK